MAAAVFRKKSDPADLLLYKSMLLLFIFSPAYQFTSYVINQENIVSGSPYIKRKRSPPAARVGLLYDNEIPSIVYTSSARVRSSFE